MQKNNINHPRISQVMETEEAFWKFIDGFDIKNYPLIVKFCHLTQGSQGAKVEDSNFHNLLQLRNPDTNLSIEYP